MITKACRSCGQVKALTEFNRHRANADKFHVYCRVCYNARRKTPEQRVYDNNRMKRRRLDPKFKLARYFSDDLRKMLRAAVHLRKLGYTCEDLLQHIEAQFQPGMNWDNFGLWHIDHIEPISSRKFSFQSLDDPDFARCQAISNLRPLWSKDNMIKGTMNEVQFRAEQARRFLESL